MVKQKFSALDVAAAVAEMQQSIVGLRLQNIYDVNAKTFTIKFSRPDDKQTLLVESGARVHLTDFHRDQLQLPSQFCAKLRQHLRTRRLTNIKQMGVDRIVHLEFGAYSDAAHTFHLLIELYASGNVILCDSQWQIMALLRNADLSEDVKYAVGQQYPIQSVKVSFDEIMLQKCHDSLAQLEKTVPQAAAQSSGGKKKPGKEQVRKWLAMQFDVSQTLVEHAMCLAEMPLTMKLSDLKLNAQQLFYMLQPLRTLELEIVSKPQGCLVLRRVKLEDGDEEQRKSANLIQDTTDPQYYLAYEEYHAFAFAQFSNQPDLQVKQCTSFNAAVDEYHSFIESQRLAVKSRQQAINADAKLSKAAQEQQARVEAYAQMADEQARMAQLIEWNTERVDQALTVIRQALASGMDWQQLRELVTEERMKQNPVAMLIVDMNLESNKIVLELGYGVDDYVEHTQLGMESDDNEEQDDPKPAATARVIIDIDKSAYANSRKYYEQRKLQLRKHETAQESTHKALAATQQKIEREAKVQVKQAKQIVKARKPFWFEKFIWFISTENYLVLAGRDAQQNELLVKRHLRPGDVYAHADVQGSASVIVKNHSLNDEIPLSTLHQASQMCIVYSRAWDAKIVTSAYWVHADQVSKQAPTGESLGTGSFMIRGKKNYLPPTQLVYGFGLLFRVADECIARHYNDRRPQLRGEDDVDDVVDTDIKPSAKALASSDAVSIAPTLLESAMEKYSLEDYGQQEEEPSGVLGDLLQSFNAVTSSTQVIGTTKSKRQQQQQRKPPAPIIAESSVSGKSTQPAVKRGQKAKMKKIKEKYADQDEDDRLAALSKNQGVQAVAKVTPAVMVESKPEIVKLPKPVTRLKTDTPEPGESDKDKAEVARLLMEENITTLQADEAENLTVLDSLTGTPHEDDLLLFAIPVCAPYPTLAQYKYKAKLIPGSLKKGKAATQLQHAFSQKAQTSGSVMESDLIKIIPENEMIQSVLGKVKITSVDDTATKASKSKQSNQKRRR